MFIPDEHGHTSGKGNVGDDRERLECRRQAAALATKMAATFGGDIGKLTNEIDGILDFSFMINKSYEMVRDYKKDDKELHLHLALQGYLAIMGKLTSADIPLDAMPLLASSIFINMHFHRMLPRLKELSMSVFRNEDRKRERRQNGND